MPGLGGFLSSRGLEGYRCGNANLSRRAQIVDDPSERLRQLSQFVDYLAAFDTDPPFAPLIQ